MIDIIMGYNCNVQCDYCTITDGMRCQNLTTSDILRALEQGRKAGLMEVAFGGGEPTIRKDLVRLANAAHKLGYTLIKVSSNGLMYAYKEFASSLIEAGVTQFNISFMGWNKAQYSAIMGQERYFELVRQGVSTLVEAGANVVGDVIMKRGTHSELERTVEFWAELGVSHFVLWLVSLTDRNQNNLDSLVSVTELRPHMAAAFEAGRRRGIGVVSRHIPRCLLRGYEDHVWDVRQDKVYVVTPESRFWLSESRITANTYSDKCLKCKIKPNCMGIRADYLAHIGDNEIVPFEA